MSEPHQGDVTCPLMPSVESTEASSRLSHERYRALIEVSSQAVWSWTLDGKANEVERAQRWWEELTGQTVEQQRANADAWLEMIHPDDRDAAASAWADAVGAGGIYDSEYRVRGREGGWRTVRGRGVPVRTGDGTVREWVGTLEDVTATREAEARLQRVTAESERQRRMYETALLNTADFIYLFDLSGRFTYVNKALLNLWGKTLAEAVGRNFFDLGYPSELAARLQRQIQEVIDTGRTVRDETPYTSASGTWAYEYIFVPVFGTDRTIEAVAGSTRDITDRKESETALRTSEERYRVLVTASSDVVYRMSADWSEMQPLDGRELVGSTAKPIRDWMTKNLPAFEHARVTAAIKAAIAGKDVFELEHQVIRADGTLGWTSSRAAPIFDAAGNIVEWFGTARDVTPRKQAEETLARVTDESDRRKRLYETILSNTPDLAYVFDLDHRFIYANDILLRMWGKTWDEAIGKTCIELGYEPWHAAMHDREIEEVKSTRRPIRGEVPFHGAFGRRIYDYIFVPVIGAGGEVEAIAGTTRDVTDRKASEEALRDADRKKDDFIALLAHELRNPLAPIRNGLQMMRLAGSDAAAFDRTRSMMERQLAHMVRLIDDLLDVSRVTRNKLELRRTRILLAEVIANAVEAAGPAIEEAGHELTITLPSEPIILDADLTRLAQVFSNLLTNSAKYTPSGGRISLSAERSDNEAVVSVRDTGIGIPADALPTIFDMFSQVDRSIERSAGGLGIGLALVKGLVDMHGGSVFAESAEGQGSTFTVRLPLAKAAPVDSTIAESPVPEHPPRRRVLVVDDNRDSAESMAALLKMLGNDVTMAHDGLEAVSFAESFRPEVILMDVGLPGLSGLDATRRIREQSWGQSMTVIALTGWGQENDRLQSREAGCNAHLVKPVEFAELERLLGDKRPPA